MAQTNMAKGTPVKSSTPKNRIEKPLKQTSNNNGDFNLKVQEMAYQLFIARGCAHGYDVEDWLAAEQIVRGS